MLKHSGFLSECRAVRLEVDRGNGAMPLTARSTNSPSKAPFDQVALAVILSKAHARRASKVD